MPRKLPRISNLHIFSTPDLTDLKPLQGEDISTGWLVLFLGLNPPHLAEIVKIHSHTTFRASLVIKILCVESCPMHNQSLFTVWNHEDLGFLTGSVFEAPEDEQVLHSLSHIGGLA